MIRYRNLKIEKKKDGEYHICRLSKGKEVESTSLVGDDLWIGKDHKPAIPETEEWVSGLEWSLRNEYARWMWVYFKRGYNWW